MKNYFVGFWMFFSTAALGGAEVCVRDYLGTGVDPCERGIQGFDYLINIDEPEIGICSRVYDDSNCKDAPESFDHVYNMNKEVVCTVDFHNPPYSMSCASQPEEYVWVTAAYPDY
jgi:hypothetical protein